MKLGTKIVLGFTSLLAIAVLLGGVAVWRMWGVQGRAIALADEYVPEVNVSNTIERAALLTMYEMRGYGFTEDDQYLTRGRENVAAVEKSLGEAKDLADRSPHLVKLKDAVGEMQAKVDQYEEFVARTVAENKSIAENRVALDSAAAAYMSSCYGFQGGQNEMMRNELAGTSPNSAQAGTTSAPAGASITAPASAGAAPNLVERLDKINKIGGIIDACNAVRVACFKAQALRNPKLIGEADNKFTEMKSQIDAIRKQTRQKINLDQLDQIDQAADAYRKAMNELATNMGDLQQVAKQRGEVAAQILEKAQNIANLGLEQSQGIASEAKTSLSLASKVVIIGLAAAVVVGCILSVVITRGITKPLNRIISGLNEGADQVNDAAGQVSTASQQLAEGASEQASSLEETSSALEEMAAMTRTNAANSKQANELAGQARDAAESGDKTMTQLNDAMVGINESSEKISKIIKVIEEIAFQTNLLALNAAVEAARAGEHGKGFAVVADEVRNLAQRCAQAARETTGLIEDAVNRSQRGTQVAGEVAKSLSSIVGSVVKVSDLLNGISAASDEQAQGVDQVNTAVSQMDKVTQSNASGAEESASAAEELAAQAQAVKGMVSELIAMVGGSRATDSGRTIRASTRTTSTKPSALRSAGSKKALAVHATGGDLTKFDASDSEIGQF